MEMLVFHYLSFLTLGIFSASKGASRRGKLLDHGIAGQCNLYTVGSIDTSQGWLLPSSLDPVMENSDGNTPMGTLNNIYQLNVFSHIQIFQRFSVLAPNKKILSIFPRQSRFHS